MKKWTSIKTSNDGTSTLWFNSQTNTYSVWCNKAEVKGFTTDNAEQAEINFNNYLAEKEANILTLNRYLQLNNITLTETEFNSLDAIFGEGSFYEESAKWDEEKKEYYVERDSGTFIGWYIDEEEVPGCRGALASLVKKGILTIAYDDSVRTSKESACYYIHFTPIFKKNGGYHELDLEA